VIRRLSALGLGCLLLASCASVPPEPLPAPANPEAAQPPAAEWQPYLTRPAPPRDSVRRRRLPPPSVPAPPRAEAAPEASTSASPETAPVKADPPGPRTLDGTWEQEHVSEGFREAFEGALVRAASGQATETDPASGAVYAVSQKPGASGCKAFEVNVLSPGGTLPVLSRGYAYRC